MQQKETNPLRYSGEVAEAIDLRHRAVRDAGLWKAVLEETRDKYARRFFEGQIELSNLRGVHYNLAVQSSMPPRGEPESNPAPVIRPPVIRAKASLEIALSERGRNRAGTEREAHHAKAAAFAMLADRSRELGMESRARAYEARASLETASAHGFEGVIKGYDKKLEDLGVRERTRAEPASLQNSLDRLERAQRQLEDFYRSQVETMGHLRRCREIETEIEALEKDSADLPSKPEGREKIEEAIYQRDTVAALAEKEALAAARCYRDFQHEVEAAHKSYEALDLAMTGSQAKTISAAPDNDGHTEAHTQGLVAAEEKPQDSGLSKPQESEPQIIEPETKHTTTSRKPHGNVALGVVAGQLLRELERGM
jgi:hypothetical protein